MEKKVFNDKQKYDTAVSKKKNEIKELSAKIEKLKKQISEINASIKKQELEEAKIAKVKAAELEEEIDLKLYKKEIDNLKAAFGIEGLSEKEKEHLNKEIPNMIKRMIKIGNIEKK